MNSQTDEVVEIRETGALATVVINNLPLNILALPVRHRLYEVLSGYKTREDIRVLVLRGAGEKAFSVGSNVKEFPLEKGCAGGIEKATFEHQLHDLIENLPQVTIAALYGYVLGGGLELALACDLRLVAHNARLGTPEINLAVFPCAGGTQRLLELVGPAYAKELMFFGEPISAEEAFKIGLVNRVLPADNFFETVEKIALALTDKPFKAITAIKQCVLTGLRKSRKEGLSKEITAFGDLFETEDLKEGICAFQEKRAPKFSHR